MKIQATRGEPVKIRSPEVNLKEDETTKLGGGSHVDVQAKEERMAWMGGKDDTGGGTYNVGNLQRCVKSSREVFFMYVRICRRSVLVSL